MEQDFLKLNQDAMEHLGFYAEEYKETILHCILSRYTVFIK